ncbi:hypothetical protein V502_10261 [Pseudogymnoascus sp. VKM F-4520 (FW-2644)]|nr:hypothetical protein V502_10261 [Pseudogymnoascus sp. VKM F-4520 (FW-2644)]
MSSILRADVHVSNRLPLAITRMGESSAFSPISCTLIHGDREAVLVDTPISISQTESLIKWIETIMPNKELAYVYVTHGHGDHWFGIPLLKKRWPNLKAVAPPLPSRPPLHQQQPYLETRKCIATFLRSLISARFSVRARVHLCKLLESGNEHTQGNGTCDQESGIPDSMQNHAAMDWGLLVAGGGSVAVVIVLFTAVSFSLSSSPLVALISQRRHDASSSSSYT